MIITSVFSLFTFYVPRKKVSLSVLLTYQHGKENPDMVLIKTFGCDVQFIHLCVVSEQD